MRCLACLRCNQPTKANKFRVNRLILLGLFSPCVLMGAVSADCKRKDLSLRNPFVSSCCSWSDPLSGGLENIYILWQSMLKLGHKNDRFNIGVLNIILSSLVLCNLSRSQHYCHLINAVVCMIFQFHNYFLNKYNHNYSNKILF